MPFNELGTSLDADFRNLGTLDLLHPLQQKLDIADWAEKTGAELLF